jgi:hypothetical protein
MRGTVREQNRTHRDGIDRMPTAAVCTARASPFRQGDVAGVSMETSEPRIQDEEINESSRDDISSSLSTLSKETREKFK